MFVLSQEEKFLFDLESIKFPLRLSIKFHYFNDCRNNNWTTIIRAPEWDWIVQKFMKKIPDGVFWMNLCIKPWYSVLPLNISRSETYSCIWAILMLWFILILLKSNTPMIYLTFSSRIFTFIFTFPRKFSDSSASYDFYFLLSNILMVIFSG